MLKNKRSTTTQNPFWWCLPEILQLCFISGPSSCFNKDSQETLRRIESNKPRSELSSHWCFEDVVYILNPVFFLDEVPLFPGAPPRSWKQLPAAPVWHQLLKHGRGPVKGYLPPVLQFLCKSSSSQSTLDRSQRRGRVLGEGEIRKRKKKIMTGAGPCRLKRSLPHTATLQKQKAMSVWRSLCDFYIASHVASAHVTCKNNLSLAIQRGEWLPESHFKRKMFLPFWMIKLRNNTSILLQDSATTQELIQKLQSWGVGEIWSRF